MRTDVREALVALELKLNAILPGIYQDAYENVQPVSMGSAGLKYGSDGQVAWDDMWDSFCDLAMAGGPPHKGSLLEPGGRTDIDMHPERYRQVTDEICRGITAVTGQTAERCSHPGWVRMACPTEGAAGWLHRAIVMENVSVRHQGLGLELPAAPGFRLAKEIKNVITVVAKTCHYWIDHVPGRQRRSIAKLFLKMDAAAPLAEPTFSDDGCRTERDQIVADQMAETIRRDSGLCASTHRYVGWVGVECPNVRAAIWMMRAMVVSNVLSRREGTVLFVPVNPASDRHAEQVVTTLLTIHRLAIARGVL
jgi:sirohydrochlorin cobaltochelatase